MQTVRDQLATYQYLFCSCKEKIKQGKLHDDEHTITGNLHNVKSNYFDLVQSPIK